MATRTPRRLATAALLLAFLPLLAACDTEGSGAETTVTVMSRNLYLGGDLFTLLDPSCEQQIPVCIAQLYFGSVVTSDIPGRMGAVAAEIEANDPDLVGLQEVSWFRRDLVSDFDPNNPQPLEPNADETTFDFLDILLDSLAARGLDYVVAAQNVNADVEFPATLDGENFIDLRLTDRDVILARAGLSTSNARQETYAIAAPIPIGGIEVEFTRGFSSVVVTKDGVDFTFGNTHLEVGGQAAPAQRAQATYLANRAGLGDTEPLVLVGDFNSNPDPEPDPAQEDAYEILVAAFTDTWASLRASDDGFTCCQAADLRNDTSLLDERIDLVFYRGSVRPVSIGLVGEEPGDRTAMGLWPSDHAGVVATFIVEG